MGFYTMYKTIYLIREKLTQGWLYYNPILEHMNVPSRDGILFLYAYIQKVDKRILSRYQLISKVKTEWIWNFDKDLKQ